MEASTKIKEYEETIKRLFKLLKRVCQERDEARDQLQFLLRNFHPSMKSTEVSDHHMISSKALSNCSYDLSLAMASFESNDEKHSSSMDCFSHTRMAESSNLASPKQPNHQNKHGAIKADIGASRDNAVEDSASLLINKLVWGKPLPQKGRLLKTVTEAGPLLQTLLVAPLPRWKNPPPLSSFVSTISDGKGNVNSNGFIPTSLSLAFPGSSRGPPQVSSASGSVLSVKNEPISQADMESSRIHNNQMLMGKKRELF